MKDASQDHVGLNQNILYDKIISNEGGGDHPLQGVFIAPQSGYYVLSTTCLTNNNTDIHTALVHNGNMLQKSTVMVTMEGTTKEVRLLSRG
ncbi:hypothetical protein DPMN_162928 [Dreissena polymorpha]|uniref:C1q domain-containing protein n=1 Tax=Dreissena polymorpha TaxID=45954 RepID=A0A9D4EUU4_DREPO|nr:hypothetical protein DPMN_162928 [Dreissena polymorpha]